MLKLVHKPSTMVAGSKVIPTEVGGRSPSWCLLPLLREASLSCSNNELMWLKWEGHIHFHFIKILHRYRAVGHIHSKALSWFECNSTREKREAITFGIIHLYIQTPPMFHVYCYWDLNFNPKLIAAPYWDLDDKNERHILALALDMIWHLTTNSLALLSICFPTLV